MKKISGLLRHIAAMIYDTLIVTALLMAATALLLPFHHGQAIPPHHIIYQIYLSLITFCYFSLSWIYAQQTIGMRAWGLQICTIDNKPMSLRKSVLRFIAAAISLLAGGIGLWWMLLDGKQWTWQDKWSGTYLILAARPEE